MAARFVCLARVDPHSRRSIDEQAFRNATATAPTSRKDTKQMKRTTLSLSSAIFLALQFPMPGQNFPPPESMKDFLDGMVATPSTAMVIEPTNVPPPDPNQNVPGDPTMTPPPAPYSPNTFGDGSNYEGPVGVTGYVGDTVTTGCSYSALGHSANRVIDDIVVPGSIGKYPLKMTRVL